jgi:hypothetical protein
MKQRGAANLIILVIIAIMLVGSALYFLVQNEVNDTPQITTSELENSTPTTTEPVDIAVDITASFEIYTNGTKRVFSDPRYHNLSDTVFITSDDPNQVRVKRKSIVWSEFFNSLPMELSKDCLVTGTGQEFCTNDTHQLTFTINDTPFPDALDRVINENDILKVEYSAR